MYRRCVRNPGVIYQMVSYQYFGELYTGPPSFLLGEFLPATRTHTDWASYSNPDHNCTCFSFSFKDNCVLVFWLFLSFVCECTGYCCPSCSLMHGQEASPELQRLKLLSLKMQSIMAPTYLSSSLCSSMWLLTHSGNSHGKSSVPLFIMVHLTNGPKLQRK